MIASAKSLFADNFRLVLFGAVSFMALWTALLYPQMSHTTSTEIAVWWTFLCGIRVVNICAWCLSAEAVRYRKATVDPEIFSFQCWQLILAAAFVAGCAFRSILPRADIQRNGLFDSWVSSVMVGRSVATVAELCFVIQCALLLNRFAKNAGSQFGVRVSWLLVPLIVVAEVFSWYAVLTTSNLGHAIEESIWALSALLIVVSCFMLWPRSCKNGRRILTAVIVCGVLYLAFMVLIDVPMYATRWLGDEAAGREYLSLSQGLHDVWHRRHITHEWEAWRTEIPWMSLYFSVGVWCSLALVHVRWLKPKNGKAGLPSVVISQENTNASDVNFRKES